MSKTSSREVFAPKRFSNDFFKQMETVFKVGQKVFDFAYGKGEVINVQNSRYLDNIILVKFDNRGVPVRYSLDGRQINFRAYGGELDPENVANKPTLSTKEYTLHGFEQKAPAPTYGEALVKAKTNFNGYPSYELAMAAEALQKLLFLRDYYNKGWRPDWSNTNVLKYVIIVSREKIEIDNTYNIKRILAFKSKEIRNKFLEEQKELLEIAKPLL